MLQATYNKEAYEIIIRADYFEFDRIYFMIERLTGRYGIDRVCLLSGYENASIILQSLNYEIRRAQHGDRELYVQYNGLNEMWLAPTGTPDTQIEKEYETTIPNKIIDEIDDAIMVDLDMDLDEFYDLDADEQRNALEELCLVPDTVDTFLSWLHRDPTFYFASDEYPGASEKNTLLQFRLPLPEAILYALVLRDFLLQKETLIANAFMQARDIENGDGGYDLFFCRRRFRPELALLDMFTEELLSCLCSAIDEKNYDRLQSTLASAGCFRDATKERLKVLERLTTESPVSTTDEILQLIHKLQEV